MQSDWWESRQEKLNVWVAWLLEGQPWVEDHHSVRPRELEYPRGMFLGEVGRKFGSGFVTMRRGMSPWMANEGVVIEGESMADGGGTQEMRPRSRRSLAGTSLSSWVSKNGIRLANWFKCNSAHAR